MVAVPRIERIKKMQLTRKTFLLLAVAGALFAHAGELAFKIAADREDCLSVEGDILPVTARALIPIIADIREAIEGIEKELGKAGD